jgi:transcriptional regulator
MYIPKHYQTTDKDEILGFMRSYSFATIICAKDNYPVATHLPFVIEENDHQIILSSHFAKANTQWQHLTGQDVLVIFAEPHAYISPSHYDTALNVPTWNYVAVHAYGKGEIIKEPDSAFALLDTMIKSFEPDYKAQWDSLPADFRQKMLNGIVAFKIVVTDLQAKKKLSQNRKEAERNRIIAAFEHSHHAQEQSIGELMKQNEGLLK